MLATALLLEKDCADEFCSMFVGESGISFLREKLSGRFYHAVSLCAARHANVGQGQKYIR